MDSTFLSAFGLFSAFFILSKLLYDVTPLLRKFAIQPPILCGVSLLICGPEGFGILPREVYDHWKQWPAFLVSLVFAGLILGDDSLGKLRTLSDTKLYRDVLLQAIFVWFLAASQLAIGFLVVIVVGQIIPISPYLGHIIEIGWIGGHGAGAALATTLEMIGASNVAGLGLFSATVGLVFGGVSGLWIVQHIHRRSPVASEEIAEGPIDGKTSPTDRPSLTFTISFFGSTILLGLLFRVLVSEPLTRFGLGEWAGNLPLFFFCLLAAFPVRLLAHKMPEYNEATRAEIRHVGSFVLDLLIASAVASLNMSVLTENLLGFFAVMIAAAVWVIVCFYFFAKRMLPNQGGIELAIINYGMSTGITALGLYLLKVYSSKIPGRPMLIYGLAAPLSAPFIGGGAISLLLPLMTQKGFALEILLGSSGLAIFLYLLTKSILREKK